MNVMVLKYNGKISFEVWLAQTELQKALNLKILYYLKMSTENISIFSGGKKKQFYLKMKNITLTMQINFTISKLVFLLNFTYHQSISCSFLKNESTIEMCK